MASALAVAGALLSALATLYALAALLCSPRTWRPPRGGVAPVPVSVLKPLCGAEPNLERQLASLCRQTHPCYQLVFGVRDPDDPAAATVARLARRFPELDIRLVADPRVHGSNLKVSNLINMRAAARFYTKARTIAVRNDYTDVLLLSLNALGAATFEIGQCWLST